MGNGFTRKAICISVILLMSSGFSVAGATADSCRGSADCLICARQPHHHLPNAQTAAENSGCVPGGASSTCGFESAQRSGDIYGLASAERSLQPVRSVIFAGTAEEDDPFQVSARVAALLSLSDPAAKAPIYLLNHSLIC